MTGQLNIALFCHSLVSDWNHGNAHFLRGLMRELVRMGHSVRSYEELGSWSLTSLMQNEGDRAVEAVNCFRNSFPELDVRFYKSSNEKFSRFLEEELRGVDLVLLHEWNEPHVVNSVLELKKKLGFAALFHDSHHRAYTRAGEILKFHLHLLDGVLAFGEAVRRIYADGFGVQRVWTFHEAADTNHFRPLNLSHDIDVAWIGNWGDEERTAELEEFLISPAAQLKGCKVVAHGVRYPAEAVTRLQNAGIEFRGYLPNLCAPEVYSRSHLSLHVPRRQYANGLSGIPTIRVFEALACGAPLVCSPWTDEESLFHPGEDYVVVKDGKQMKTQLQDLLRDERARRQIGEQGMRAVRQRHTCALRAEQLISIFEELAA